MSTEVDKKQWVTIVDFLRFITPISVGLLVYQVQNFQTSLEKNTLAIQEVQTTLARIDEKEKYTSEDVKATKESVALLNNDNNENKREIQGLSLRFAAIEHTAGAH